MTPPLPREEPLSQAIVVITCEGSCKHPRTSVQRWTRHIFLRLDPVPRGQARIYACTTCGTERRYGLLGPTADDD